jgi:hypothetical protein
MSSANTNRDPNEGADEALVVSLGDLKNALGRTSPADRKSYIGALLSMARFIDQILGIEAANPVLDLAVALSDLEQGARPPLLEPSPSAEERPDPSAEWEERTNAALALECLVRCREDIDVAAGKLARSRKFEAKTLINWRRELMSGRVANALAGIMFSEGLARLDLVSRDDLRQRAALFMERSTRHRTP